MKVGELDLSMSEQLSYSIPMKMSVIVFYVKSYAHELDDITGSIFFVVHPGEGDQGLLDVRFPDVNSHGQGLLIAFYGAATADSTIAHQHNGDSKNGDDKHGNGAMGDEESVKDSKFDDKMGSLAIHSNISDTTHRQAESKSSSLSSPRVVHQTVTKYTGYYQKLTLWQSFGSSNMMMDFNELMAVHHQQPVKVDTTNLTTDGYQQTYIILKEPDRSSSGGLDNTSSKVIGYDVRGHATTSSSSSSAAYRDVLFRFGSWCYTGRIRLVESELELSDVPIMIPVLRVQQSALEFAYEVSELVSVRE